MASAKGLRAVFTVPELARMLGLTPQSTRRLLERIGLPIDKRMRASGPRSAGRHLVWLRDVQLHAPEMWDSLSLVWAAQGLEPPNVNAEEPRFRASA